METKTGEYGMKNYSLIAALLVTVPTHTNSPVALQVLRLLGTRMHTVQASCLISTDSRTARIAWLKKEINDLEINYCGIERWLCEEHEREAALTENLNQIKQYKKELNAVLKAQQPHAKTVTTLGQEIDDLKRNHSKHTQSYLLEVAARHDHIRTLQEKIIKLERCFNPENVLVQQALAIRHHAYTQLMLLQTTRHADYTKQNHAYETQILTLQEEYNNLLTANRSLNRKK